MDLKNLPNVFTVKELADYMKVNFQTIKKAIKDGKLEAFKVGRDWRIDKDSVLRWIGKGEN